MALFIKTNNKNREILFNKVKENYEKSWKEIARRLSISRAMLFYYKGGAYPIPKNLFNKIIKIAKIKIIYKQINKQSKFLKKEMTIPTLNERLAEILGAINGDGHISNINYEVSITGSRLDQKYFNYLKKSLEQQFNLKFRMISQDTRIRLKTYSKELAYFLNKNYEAPLGKKTGDLKIPSKIKNKKLLIAYLRGLFDTDGSIYTRRKKDVVIEIISVDKNYLKQIKELLIYLGFTAGSSGKNIYIYKKQEIIHFFNLIKPANNKHLKKYKVYSNLLRQ